MEKLLNGYQTACNNCKIKINSAKYASFALIEKFGEPKKFYAPSPILERSKGHRESIKGRMPAKKGIVSLYYTSGIKQQFMNQTPFVINLWLAILDY